MFENEVIHNIPRCFYSSILLQSVTMYFIFNPFLLPHIPSVSAQLIPDQTPFFPSPLNFLFPPPPFQQQPSVNPTGSSSSAGYNEQYAQLLLGLSAGAYALSPTECIQRLYSPADQMQLYLNGSALCDELGSLCSFYIVVSRPSRQLIVVFRGTRNLAQLLEEGLGSTFLLPVDFYGVGKVNAYFYQGLNGLWPSIQPVLADPAFAGFSLAFTGHSLGGALASLAAITTVLEGLRSGQAIQLYTFGQPRIGSSSFAFRHDALLPNSYRVVNDADIVPHLPPCSNSLIDDIDSAPCSPLTSGVAYHHGVEVWYPHGMPGPYRVCRGPPLNEDATCSNSVTLSLLRIPREVDKHRHYFGHKIPAWGKLGCQLGVEAEEEALPNEALTAAEFITGRDLSSLNGGKKKKKTSFLGKIIGKMEKFFGRR